MASLPSLFLLPPYLWPSSSSVTLPYPCFSLKASFLALLLSKGPSPLVLASAPVSCDHSPAFPDELSLPSASWPGKMPKLHLHSWPSWPCQATAPLLSLPCSSVPTPAQACCAHLSTNKHTSTLFSSLHPTPLNVFRGSRCVSRGPRSLSTCAQGLVSC